MNILLVEPDSITVRLVTQAFEQRGHLVRCAGSAQAALDSMAEVLPDAIVLEVQLGVHNGIEFLYEMRSYTDWQHIPVVVYSLNQAVRRTEFRASFRQLGVRDVLYKSATPIDVLQRAVESVVTAVA